MFFYLTLVKKCRVYLTCYEYFITKVIHTTQSKPADIMPTWSGFHLMLTSTMSFSPYDIVHHNAKKKLPSYEVTKSQCAVLLY